MRSHHEAAFTQKLVESNIYMNAGLLFSIKILKRAIIKLKTI
jgi:hypothetical protein